MADNRMMSNAEERRWYGEIAPWTEEQLAQYCRDMGFPKADTSDAAVLPKMVSPPLANAQRPQQQDDSGRS
jgi:hypothetical protein